MSCQEALRADSDSSACYRPRHWRDGAAGTTTRILYYPRNNRQAVQINGGLRAGRICWRMGAAAATAGAA